MKTALLIGTSHEYQRPAPGPGGLGSEQFRTVVASAVAQTGAKAIAEEMSLEALKLHGVDRSICAQVADHLGVAHRYCDPSSRERTALGIREDDDIRMSGFFANRDSRQIEAAVRAAYAIRERYWFEQILDLNAWPLLFVCGANHIDPFRELLEANGIAVRVLFANWTPD